jgi:glycosyltransferase involved in cell wall biosynthesis
MIKFSIVTINLNNSEGLKKTFKSVFNQKYRDFEYIVVDGSSKDGSVNIIKENSQQIQYWITEPDSGIYNAMNKGISKVTAEYIFFLNSGDILFDENVLGKIAPQLTGEQIIYADFVVDNCSKRYIKKFDQTPGYNFFVHDCFQHSGAVFAKRDCFTGNLKNYDENLKIAADWKWFMQAILIYKYSYKHIPLVTSVFDYTGISAANPKLLYEEKFNEFEKLFPGLFNELIELNDIKNKYAALSNSRYLNFFIKLKKLLPIRQ